MESWTAQQEETRIVFKRTFLYEEVTTVDVLRVRPHALRVSSLQSFVAGSIAYR